MFSLRESAGIPHSHNQAESKVCPFHVGVECRAAAFARAVGRSLRRIRSIPEFICSLITSKRARRHEFRLWRRMHHQSGAQDRVM